MSRGFTLIELLIVVAIIGILAAIAIPNFLLAQTRAKVAKTKADMKTVSTAIESYAVDYSNYPNDHDYGFAWCLPTTLTTPTSYISSMAYDIFKSKYASPWLTPDEHEQNRRFRYVNYRANLIFENWNDLGRMPWFDSGYFIISGIYWRMKIAGGPEVVEKGYRNFGEWILVSAGPQGTVDFRFFSDNLDDLYDPTNGTISHGNIIRSMK